MSKNEKKHPQGCWIAVGISARRIMDGQTITVDGCAEIIS
jgi:hypothetical protein